MQLSNKEMLELNCLQGDFTKKGTSILKKRQKERKKISVTSKMNQVNRNVTLQNICILAKYWVFLLSRFS